MTDMTWHQTKAAEMIEREIAAIAESDYPSDDYLLGLISMAIALDAINDEQFRGYVGRGNETVRERRRQLREAKIQEAIKRNV